MTTRQIDVGMWRDALTGIPRVDQHRWSKLDYFGRWLITIRAAVLVMTLLATVISGVFAYQHGLMDWGRFWMVVVGLLSAHATNNILNDLSDHRRGVDKDNAFRTRYGTQPVEEGLISPRQSLCLAVVTVIPMLVTAIWLTLLVGQVLIPFALAGVVLVFAYNWPLKHFGLGEPTVIVVWGRSHGGRGLFIDHRCLVLDGGLGQPAIRHWRDDCPLWKTHRQNSLGPASWRPNPTRSLGSSMGALDRSGLGRGAVFTGGRPIDGRLAAMAGLTGPGQSALFAQVGSGLFSTHSTSATGGLSTWRVASLVFCSWICSLSKFWTALHLRIVDQSVASVMGAVHQAVGWVDGKKKDSVSVGQRIDR